MKPNIYDSWRHYLFLSYLLIILAVYGFITLYESKLKIFKFMAVILIVIYIFSSLKTVIQLHPYEYLYFNQLVGGLKQAHKNYDTDYWGLSFKESMEFVTENYEKIMPNGGILYISHCYNDFLINRYLENYDRFIQINDKSSHIFICYTRWNLHNSKKGKIIFKVEKEQSLLNMVKFLDYKY